MRDIILPSTRDTRCRYADLPELMECFGPATVFVSHCWGAKFGDKPQSLQTDNAVVGAYLPGLQGMHAALPSPTLYPVGQSIHTAAFGLLLSRYFPLTQSAQGSPAHDLQLVVEV